MSVISKMTLADAVKVETGGQTAQLEQNKSKMKIMFEIWNNL